MFTISKTAPKLPADYTLLSSLDVEPILDGLQPIAESIQDNDIERWGLTQAGQFLRETGKDGGRFYVVPDDEAFDFLNGWILDDILEALKKSGAFSSDDFTASVPNGHP